MEPNLNHKQRGKK